MPVYTIRKESAEREYSEDAVALVEAAINQVLTEAPNLRDFRDKFSSDARELIGNLTSGVKKTADKVGSEIQQKADRTQAGINVIRNKGPKSPAGVQRQREKAQAKKEEEAEAAKTKKEEEAALKDAKKRETHAAKDIIYLNNKVNRGEQLTARQMQRLRTYDAQQRGGKNPSWIEAWD